MAASTFLFHGYALGFGATFRRPYYSSIPSQASAVVSIGGGYACERVGPSVFCNGTSFEEATSVVTGGVDEDGGWITIAKSTVRKLNLLDGALIADELHCQLVSRHGGASGAEPNISAAGSYIKGLRIGGVEINTGNFLDLPETDEGFRSKFYADGEWARRIRESCNWVRPGDMSEEQIHPELLAFYGKSWEKGCEQPPTFNGRMIVSTFDKLECVPSRGVVVMGNTVTLRNVGRFHLGELLIERGNRRLSMLRFSLGSDTEGQGSGAHSGTNGSPYP
jgi:hypothetical protein